MVTSPDSQAFAASSADIRLRSTDPVLAERYNVWIPVTWAPGNGDTYALKGLSKAASWVNQGMAEADETPKQIKTDD